MPLMKILIIAILALIFYVTFCILPSFVDTIGSKPGKKKRKTGKDSKNQSTDEEGDKGP